MSDKIWLDAQQLLEDAWRLGARVVASGYRPTRVIAPWRGGVPIGVAVQAFLHAAGIDCDHFAIRTAHYAGMAQREQAVTLYGLEDLVVRSRADDRLLLVDDVWDTGITVQTLLTALRDASGAEAPAEVRVAVPYFKPRFNRTPLAPDYFLHQTEAWLMYPHSLEGATAAEIATHRPALAAILAAAVSPDRGAGMD